MTRLDLPGKPRILVVTLRRLGDVLLATPRIRSLRRVWPQARIEALVFADTAGILAGNPDLDRIVTVPPQPSAGATLSLGARLFPATIWRSRRKAVTVRSALPSSPAAHASRRCRRISTAALSKPC